MILQQFDLVFTVAKAKNSLVFAELLSDLPIVDPNETTHNPLPDEAIYLIDTTDPWYDDILVYLQSQWFCPELSSGFTPFRLAYGLEAVLPIECQIPSLQIVVELLPDTTVEEEHLLYLNQLDETRRDAELALEAQKRQVKAQYSKKVKPCSYQEEDIVLLYDKKHDLLGARTLQPLWLGPYVFKKALSKGAFKLQDWEGVPLAKPRNQLYLKSIMPGTTLGI
eukprot:PITA_30263